MTWRAGDLAVIVMGVEPRTCPSHGKPLSMDRVYRVEAVVDCALAVALVIGGHHSTHWSRGYRAEAFRKVVRDGLGDEVLNRSKREVSA